MILVTGASGQLASQIVAIAKGRKLPVLTASRSADADRQMDFDNPASLDFSDVDTLLLTSAGYAEDDVVMRRHDAVIEAARSHQVQHVVYTSLSKASDHLGFALAHRWTEAQLRQSGLNWTILRNGLYAELIGTLASPINGKIISPFGNGLISAVARCDLAAVAAEVLADPIQHHNQIYELSGDQAFSLQELAENLGLEYAPTSLEAERSRLENLSLLPFQAPMLMSIFAAGSAGFLETGATDLKRFIEDPENALKTAVAAASG